MGGEAFEHDAMADEVRVAFRRWARTVFSGPRHAQDLIARVDARDEVIERLVTAVVRRSIREVRAATRERRSTVSRLSPATVDPFAHTTETLRVDSQYIAQCQACAASGMARCDACRGSCTVECRNCGGSGKQRSEKTGRPINCKVCKKVGRVPCGTCVATGAVACRTCSGSGHQLAWLTFDESEHWQVSVMPDDSPVADAHRDLTKARPLAPHELSAFSVLAESQSQGPIDLHHLAHPYRELPRVHRASLDSRLERIVSQQYLRLAVVRRDVTYEMCGTQATVALSGSDLIGATTPEAVRPIRRRLYAWLASIVLVAVIGTSLRDAFIGSSRYFSHARDNAGLLAAMYIGFAIPVLGALLRAWRGGLRFHSVSRRTVAFAGVTVLALLGIVIIGLTSWPTQDEVRTALDAGDVQGARLALDALREREAGAALDDLDDRVMLAEAARASGARRLGLLDEVASRKRAAAAEAAATARFERLAEVRRLIEAKQASTALTAIEQSFRDDRSVEVNEERARVLEVELAQCEHDACRLGKAAQAHATSPGRARASLVETLRARVVEELAVERIDARAPLLARLRELRKFVDAGARTMGAVAGDEDLRSRARRAIAFAAEERARVPLLRADRDVVDELLGGLSSSRGGSRAELQGTYAYVNFDATNRCTGIYVVGRNPSNRALKSEDWSADRILSQAIGKAASVRQPKQPTATMQWHEGGHPVLARWLSGQLVELRIGSATP